MGSFEVFMATLSVGGLFLIGYDIYLLKKHQLTISEETKAMAIHAPILAWGFGLVTGVLAGHFFWSICG